jgi:hypothetical protein
MTDTAAPSRGRLSIRPPAKPPPPSAICCPTYQEILIPSPPLPAGGRPGTLGVGGSARVHRDGLEANTDLRLNPSQLRLGDSIRALCRVGFDAVPAVLPVQLGKHLEKQAFTAADARAATRLIRASATSCSGRQAALARRRRLVSKQESLNGAGTRPLSDSTRFLQAAARVCFHERRAARPASRARRAASASGPRRPEAEADGSRPQRRPSGGPRPDGSRREPHGQHASRGTEQKPDGSGWPLMLGRNLRCLECDPQRRRQRAPSHPGGEPTRARGGFWARRLRRFLGSGREWQCSFSGDAGLGSTGAPRSRCTATEACGRLWPGRPARACRGCRGPRQAPVGSWAPLAYAVACE